MADTPGDALAILIDADNANPAIVKGLIAEVAKFGRATVRRIYGDWTSDRLKSWKTALLEHSIQPIQQFGYTTGKNATDSAMIIDAMDLLYAGNLDGFCIVSSDSDFTRLAIRLREAGKLVYGFGEKKTPESLQSACNEFKYFEILAQNRQADSAVAENTPEKSESGRKTDSKPAPDARKSPRELAMDTRLVSLIRSAIESLSDEDGYAPMGEVKKHMVKNFSAFDSRNYGFTKFSDLVRAIGLFEVDAQKQRIKDRRRK